MRSSTTAPATSPRSERDSPRRAPSSTPRALPRELERASGVVVPGVGHFSATAALDAEWRAAIRQSLDRGVPLFGICLGQQWLFDGSEEDPAVPGLGVIAGPVPPAAADAEGAARRLELARDPQAVAAARRASNQARRRTSPTPTPPRSRPKRSPPRPTPRRSRRWSKPISLFGVQFHPEKSGTAGIQMLRNFVAVCSPSA